MRLNFIKVNLNKTFNFLSFTEHSFPFRCLITFLILARVLSPISWMDNEYHYLMTSYLRLVDSDNSYLFASYNSSFHRLFSEYIFGSFLYCFGIEPGWKILRILTLIFISYSYSLFTNNFKFNTFASSLALSIFTNANQAFYAGEWIFGAVEAKVFSYAFILLGFAYLKNGMQKRSFFCITASIYFHFLVGFFWGSISALYLLFSDKKNKKFFIFLSLICLTSVPMLFLLIAENMYFANIATPVFGFDINHIYSSIRLPHHTRPFSGETFLWKKGFITMTISFLYVIFSFYYFRLRDESFIKTLLIVYVYLLFALLVAFIDQPYDFFGKFYLHRPSSLLKLFTLVIFLDLLYLNFLYKKNIKLLRSITAFLLVIICLHPYFKHGTSIFKSFFMAPTFALDSNSKNLINWIYLNTNTNDVFLFEETKGTFLSATNFEIITLRPSLVNWKAIPSTNDEIFRWYQNYLTKMRIFDGDCDAVSDMQANYFIAHTEVAQHNLSKCLALTYSNDSYSVFKK
jgi:hypothetical protein